MSTHSPALSALIASRFFKQLFKQQFSPALVTMVHQDVAEVRQMIDGLQAATRNKGKKTFTCKKSTFAVEKSDGISVDSWKFMDWDYKRDDLPTYARGLFTTVRKDKIPEIAVRGYDKFFNVGEVPETKWDYIEAHTRGPYELSVKENGCIIFISGLEDGTLLVCSKHSTGFRQDTSLSHACAGEQWVERHLGSIGKTKKDLAAELRRMNATAVGELCDDRFEEHVLAYDENAAGIYLHGVNYNTPEFATLPSSEVHEFATAWGFKMAQFLVMDDLDIVKKFLDQCAETGSWNGRDTEGFVIRCKMNTDPGTYRDWFFKYKFEEPYLMYRQWREATKAVIAGRKPNIKKHQKITEEYLHYARKQLVQNPQIAKLYNQNHGIIAMRDGFLRERGLRGSEIIAMEKVTRDVVLVPVASLGCGKTTVALALSKLFNWGHVQNDDIPKQKNRPQKFALELNQALIEHPVVIADRNNHQKRERKQIMDDVLRVIPNARFVAFQYLHEPKQLLLDEIREITRKRVLDRGDNHQTIKAGSKNSQDIIGIMEGFLDRFEAVNTDREPDDGFDEVIDLNVADSSRENLEKIVSALHSRYPDIIKHMPKPEELDEALDVARHGYHVEKDLGQSSNKQNRKQDKKNDPGVSEPRVDANVLVKRIQYFKISLRTSQVMDILSSLFPQSTPPLKAKLYNQLLKTRRLLKDFHVTLIHKSSKELPDIWEYYKDLYLAKMNERGGSDPNVSPVLGSARVRVERLVWNDAIMAFVVRIMPATTAGKTETDWRCANEIPHITVGTVSPEVKPKESHDLLKLWLEVGSGENTGIWEAEVPSMTVLEGSVEAFITRRTR